jgi:hypothetical protein
LGESEISLDNLLEQYRILHQRGNFPGKGVIRHLKPISVLVKVTRSATMLDYGSGKGLAYTDTAFFRERARSTAANAVAALGLQHVTCYDPGVAEFSALPAGPFDGVICTDVLEHVPEQDISHTLQEIFDRASRFVYLNIASYPAQGLLPNGENEHVTIRSARWWRAAIGAVPKTAGLKYRADIDLGKAPLAVLQQRSMPWRYSIRND